MRKPILPLVLASLLATGLFASASDENAIQWQPWSNEAFTQAKTEHKLVMMDLEAVWCHWCHVMDEKTYHDPRVIKELQRHYIALKVDQDSRPDLSNRYQDYGWPATIFFAADGTELVKRSGYIEPDDMIRLLEAIVKDPTPEAADADNPNQIKQFAASPYLDAKLKDTLLGYYRDDYDKKYGSWGTGGHKFLDWDSTEYAISRAKTGDTESEAMAKKSLDGEMNLLDPVWGGLYQYSTDGDWAHPHFERIMSVQTENMRVYLEAYALWHDPAYLSTAESIHHFLDTFLKAPDGGYYTSMDADLIQGKRRIDQHQYARENGQVIHAFCALYAVTGNAATLNEAVTAANWVVQNRSLPGGGFSHDVHDDSGPYPGDSLYMGRAFLSLYRSTGDRQWLTDAEIAAQFINAHFKTGNTQPGYGSSRDENAIMVRFANNLYHQTGNPVYQNMAKTAMRFVATPGIADLPFSATTLLADSELNQDPTHITIVGHKDDPQAQALYLAALQYPMVYKRLDWWDKREGPMPNPDVQYPELDKSAAFVCTSNRCSLPTFQPEALTALVNELTATKP